jgi:uncharacterized protein (TIGR03067 family)
MIERVLFFVALAAWPVAAAADEAKTDQDAMKGKWVIASLTVDGQQRSANTYKNLRLEIKRNKYLITQDGERASRTFKLDPTQKPKAIDITITLTYCEARRRAAFEVATY